MAIYEVNYVISWNYTVHVEADSPEDAKRVVETIYQENFDALPDDGEPDHDIDLGILSPVQTMWDSVRTIEDAFPNGRPAHYSEDDYS